MTPTFPSPRQVTSFTTAVENSIDWLKYWGYADARASFQDRGRAIDVQAGNAVAGVKFEAKHVDASTLQTFRDESPDEHKRLMFFTAVGYDQGALGYAEEAGIALFTYTIEGRVSPVNDDAINVSHARPTVAPSLEEQERDDTKPVERLENDVQAEEAIESQEPGESRAPTTGSGSQEISCLSMTIGVAALVMSLVCLAQMGMNIWGLFTDDDASWWDPLGNLALAVAFFGSIAAIPTGGTGEVRHGLAFPFFLFSLMTCIWGVADHLIAAGATGVTALLTLILWIGTARRPPGRHSPTDGS